MGRSALDEDAIRLIEKHNPEVEFDWTRILKGQDAPPEPKPSSQQERRARPRPREFPPAPLKPAGPPRVPIPEESPVVPFIGQSTSEIPAAEPSVESSDQPLPPARLQPEPDAPVAAFPQDIEVPPDESVAESAAEVQPPTAAQARLGFEGLSRLRARHAEVLARISEKVTDTVRRDELKSEAERLNPDTWVTDPEVTAGLEAYETVFESLRTVVGRRRKRRRSSGLVPGQPPSQGPDSEDPGVGDGSTHLEAKQENAPPLDPGPAREAPDELAAGSDESDGDG